MIAIQTKKKTYFFFGNPNEMCAARVIYHEHFLIENMNRAFYVNVNVLRFMDETCFN